MAIFPPILARFSGGTAGKDGVRPARPWARLANRASGILLAIYLLILAFPGALFAHHLTAGRFQVRSDEPIGPEMSAILGRAADRLGRSPIDDPDMEHRIFLCRGRALRTFLAPLQAKAFGATYPWPLRRNTILNRAIVAENLATCDAPANNRRPLDAVIAHERTHALIGRHFSDLRAWTFPAWKSEGYCEYVAGHPSFDVAEGRRLVASGMDDPSPSFLYFRYGLMVRYLIDVEHVRVDQLFGQAFEADRVMERVRSHLDEL